MSTTSTNGTSTSTAAPKARRNGKPTISPNMGTAMLETNIGAGLPTPPESNGTEKTRVIPPPLNFDGPRLSAPEIAARQNKNWLEIIETDRAETLLAITSTFRRGELYQDSIDAFKPTLLRDDWFKQRKIVISAGSSLFEEIRRKKAFPHDDLRAFALSRLITDDARAALLSPEEPLAVDTIHELADLMLHYDEDNDAFTVKRGLDAPLSDLIIETVKASRQGKTGATKDVVMRKAQALMDSVDAAGAAAAKVRTAKDRKKALASMFARLAKFIEDNKMSAAELVHYLHHEGIDEVIAEYQPAAPVNPGSRTAPKAGPSLNEQPKGATPVAGKNPMIPPSRTAAAQRKRRKSA